MACHEGAFCLMCVCHFGSATSSGMVDLHWSFSLWTDGCMAGGPTAAHPKNTFLEANKTGCGVCFYYSQILLYLFLPLSSTSCSSCTCRQVFRVDGVQRHSSLEGVCVNLFRGEEELSESCFGIVTETERVKSEAEKWHGVVRQPHLNGSGGKSVS